MDKLHRYPLLLGKLDSLYPNLGNDTPLPNLQNNLHSVPFFIFFFCLFFCLFFINFFNQCLTN